MPMYEVFLFNRVDVRVACYAQNQDEAIKKARKVHSGYVFCFPIRVSKSGEKYIRLSPYFIEDEETK